MVVKLESWMVPDEMIPVAPVMAPAVDTFNPEDAIATVEPELPIVVAAVPVELIKVVPRIVVAPLIAFVPPDAPKVLAALVPVPNVFVREAPVPIVELPEEESVVKAPDEGVVEPIGPGDAKVAPFNDEAFKLATFVVEAMTSGAVPVASVEVICPEALIVVIPESAPALMIKPLIVLVAVGAVIAPEEMVPVVVMFPLPRVSEPLLVLNPPPAVAMALPLVVSPPGMDTM